LIQGKRNSTFCENRTNSVLFSSVSVSTEMGESSMQAAGEEKEKVVDPRAREAARGEEEGKLQVSQKKKNWQSESEPSRKGKVHLKPNTRRYYFKYRKPRTPPAVRVTAKDKLAAATHAARSLEWSAGWRMWKGNASDSMFNRAIMKALKRKGWVEKWREGKKKEIPLPVKLEESPQRKPSEKKEENGEQTPAADAEFSPVESEKNAREEAARTAEAEETPFRQTEKRKRELFPSGKSAIIISTPDQASSLKMTIKLKPAVKRGREDVDDSEEDDPRPLPPSKSASGSPQDVRPPVGGGITPGLNGRWFRYVPREDETEAEEKNSKKSESLNSSLAAQQGTPSPAQEVEILLESPARRTPTDGYSQLEDNIDYSPRPPKEEEETDAWRRNMKAEADLRIREREEEENREAIRELSRAETHIRVAACHYSCLIHEQRRAKMENLISALRDILVEIGTEMMRAEPRRDIEGHRD
jgi:hypothetical protein